VPSFKLFVRVSIAAVCVLATSIALCAQRGGGAAGPTLIPVTADSLASHPATYVGQTVSMMATVAVQLSPTVFTVNQGKAKTLSADVLVVAPTLTGPPPANAYVTVVGPAVMFDPADLGKLSGYTLDIPADVAAKYKGRPAVFATAVVTRELTDLAKKKPVPLTPEEQAFRTLMTQINPASAALRTGVTASDAAASKQRAAELKKLFTDVQAFFKTKNMADAAGWAADAMKAADAADAAATASKWPEATAAAASLNQTCTQCHSAYRERLDDGTYRLKGVK
jgi:hypothetical protein